MSCNVLANADDTLACFFCDTTDVAFGPIVYGCVHGSKSEGATARLGEFRLWLSVDPRSVPVCELMDKFSEWLNR